MHALRSELISKRLNLAMLIIVACIFMLALPLIISSYKSYQKNVQSLTEIKTLKLVAELSNQISAERGPANSAMSSSRLELKERSEILSQKRKEVDAHFVTTLQALKFAGFEQAAQQLENETYQALLNGRKQVDRYLALSTAQRDTDQLDLAINAMFMAWDESYIVLQDVIGYSHAKNSEIAHYYTLILLLADLRDQAGRSASNIIASVAFNVPIPEDDLARSLQTQRQSHYLWGLVDTVQPADRKTEKFIELHALVKTEFLEKGLILVEGLLDDSLNHRPYSLSSIELTKKIVGKFSTVVDLQRYILEDSLIQAELQLKTAQRELLYTLLAAILCLVAVLMTMIYAKKWVFGPLILARQQLVALARSYAGNTGNYEPIFSQSLFGAINHLKDRLQERDVLELKLKMLAHTDSLTGVSNRFALMEYVKVLEQHPELFQQSCVVLFDIDHFKSVNDRHGHIVGDQVIQLVAEQMKHNVRSSDLLVRYGGDEFLILLEKVSLDQALQIAEKIRSAIVQSELINESLDTPLKVTVSAGVAVGAENWMALLAKADEALFRAKDKGRNIISD